MDPTATDILSLLEQLDDDIDDLEDSLTPVLETGIYDTASKLPLLDKAKLYVLVTYAVESILFSYLRLNGVKAREHPVFIELTRVKQYFDKLKDAENPASKQQGLILDKNAASRFIKAGLTGNNKLDLERAERLARERVRTHVKFNQSEQKADGPATTKATLPSSAQSNPSNSDSESTSPKDSAEGKDIPSRKRKADTLETSENTVAKPLSQADRSKGAKKKRDKKNNPQKKARTTKGD